MVDAGKLCDEAAVLAPGAAASSYRKKMAEKDENALVEEDAHMLSAASGSFDNT